MQKIKTCLYTIKISIKTWKLYRKNLFSFFSFISKLYCKILNNAVLKTKSFLNNSILQRRHRHIIIIWLPDTKILVHLLEDTSYYGHNQPKYKVDCFHIDTDPFLSWNCDEPAIISIITLSSSKISNSAFGGISHSEKKLTLAWRELNFYALAKSIKEYRGCEEGREKIGRGKAAA